ncbi:MAG: hypothetical protein M3454_18685 [Actinomycetota bacterium]|nr:hypothetical protein [Actinomycetota bacterium]
MSVMRAQDLPGMAHEVLEQDDFLFVSSTSLVPRQTGGRIEGEISHL